MTQRGVVGDALKNWGIRKPAFETRGMTNCLWFHSVLGQWAVNPRFLPLLSQSYAWVPVTNKAEKELRFYCLFCPHREV